MKPFVKARISGFECLISQPEVRFDVRVLLVLHRRGTSPEYLREITGVFGDRYLQVLPCAQHRHGAGFEWFGDGASSPAQMADSTLKLVGLLDRLQSELSIRSEQVGVLGFSQGGVMAMEVGLAVPAALAITVCIGGKLTPMSERAPQLLGRARGRRFFLVHTVLDEMVPYELSREAMVVLREHGAHVQLAAHPKRSIASPRTSGDPKDGAGIFGERQRIAQA
jgi:phospholipase/carboxylesterase